MPLYTVITEEDLVPEAARARIVEEIADIG
jgi:hypothetical protein